MKLLITGCPHSGTMFTAQVLRLAGISCGHEAVYTLQHGYRPGGSDVMAEISWEATLYLGTSSIDPGVVIAHQTREPIAWINSWVREGVHGFAWSLLEEAYPGICARQNQDPARTAMWFWVEMNRRCAKYAKHRYRVEDLRDDQGVAIIEKLGKAAGIKLDISRVRTSLTSMDIRTNHHVGDPAHVPLTWVSLPAGIELDDFKRIAQAYGYPNPL